MIRLEIRGVQVDPYIGFVSKELGEAYLKFLDWDDKSSYVASIGELEGVIHEAKEIFVFQNEDQFIKVQTDPTGYDYEKYFYRNS